MPAPEQIVFPAVQVLGIERRRSEVTISCRPWPQCSSGTGRSDTPDQSPWSWSWGASAGNSPIALPPPVASCAAGPGYSSRGPPRGPAMNAAARGRRRRPDGVVSQRTTTATVSSRFWAQSMPVQYHAPAGSGQARSAGGPGWPRQRCSRSPAGSRVPRVRRAVERRRVIARAAAGVPGPPVARRISRLAGEGFSVAGRPPRIGSTSMAYAGRHGSRRVEDVLPRGG